MFIVWPVIKEHENSYNLIIKLKSAEKKVLETKCKCQ